MKTAGLISVFAILFTKKILFVNNSIMNFCGCIPFSFPDFVRIKKQREPDTKVLILIILDLEHAEHTRRRLHP